MPSVNLMMLQPFDKNKTSWINFYNEQIFQNLMATKYNVTASPQRQARVAESLEPWPHII